MVAVVGLDLGGSGTTVLTPLIGEQWQLRLLPQIALRSVSPQEVEGHLLTLLALYQPRAMLAEWNGPGSVFLQYVIERHPSLPIVGVDTSLAAIPLTLWNGLQMHPLQFLNIRAQMYWLIRLLYRDQQITAVQEDAELFAQLSTIRWEFDRQYKDRIQIKPKREMRAFYTSSLGEVSIARSPDKADSLCLAGLAYALCQNEASTVAAPIDEIVQPEIDGYFPLGKAGIPS